MTPRYLKEETRSRGESLRKSVGREEVNEAGFRVMIIYLLFLGLIVRCRLESQEEIKERSDCTEVNEEREQMGCERSMSSAYIVSVAEGESGSLVRSLMYRLKRSGPRIEPWGTPEEAWHWEERQPEMETRWVRAVR